MTINEWLRASQNKLKEAGISTARLDCLVLLEDALGKDRAWILSHADEELQGSILKLLNTKITQRARHIPLAYIRGHAEFYGRDFTVNEHTLVPRPETETMIDLLKHIRNLEADIATWQVERRGRKPHKKQYPFEQHGPTSNLVKTDEGYKVVWQKAKRPAHTQSPAPIHGQSLRYHDEDFHLIDVGTGSGAIAITAKLELPEATVTAIDIDEKCLKTAATNAKQLKADITFLHGNLLEPMGEVENGKCYILLCNLPYVPDNFQINTAATHEPRHALFGGSDGLALYREMFSQITANQWKPEYILTESLPPQHEILADIAKAAGYSLEKTDDFIQLFTIASS
jgi:methylase of polypeptide subunit release factors